MISNGIKKANEQIMIKMKIYQESKAGVKSIVYNYF
jgi:hypothetical protein